MRSIPSLRLLSLLSILSFAASFPAFPENGGKDDGHKWSVGIGPAYRGGMDVRVSGSSRVQEAGIHAASIYRRDPRAVGPNSAPADRVYSDGGVFMDPGTPLDGLTWYWKYSNADQYNPQSQTLSFSQGGGTMVSRSVDADLPLSESGDLDGFGPTVTLTRQLLRSNCCRVHLGISLSYFDIGGDVSASTFSESYTKTTYDIVDAYDTTKGGPPPAAPYEGTYLGPGYLITNTPMARRMADAHSFDMMSARNDVRLDIDGYLLELRAGPRIDLSLGKSVWLLLTPAVSLNRVSLDVDRDENLIATYPDGASAVVEHWSDSASESDWLFGLGLGAGIGIALSERWSLAFQGRYDWVPQEQKLSAGPNDVRADFSGYTVGAGVGLSF